MKIEKWAFMDIVKLEPDIGFAPIYARIVAVSQLNQSPSQVFALVDLDAWSLLVADDKVLFLSISDLEKAFEKENDVYKVHAKWVLDDEN